jgi:hypothetical protein
MSDHLGTGTAQHRRKTGNLTGSTVKNTSMKHGNNPFYGGDPRWLSFGGYDF